jgi:hypothetical protein
MKKTGGYIIHASSSMRPLSQPPLQNEKFEVVLTDDQLLFLSKLINGIKAKNEIKGLNIYTMENILVGAGNSNVLVGADN